MIRLLRLPRRFALGLTAIHLASLPAQQAEVPGRTPPAGRIVVVGQGDNSVRVIDVRSRKQLARFTVDGRPDEVVARPDGRVAYVMVYGKRQIVVLDLVTCKPRKTVDIAPLQRPHGCAWVDRPVPGVWFTCEVDKAVAFFDPRREAVTRVIGHGGAIGHMLAVDARRGRIGVANMFSGDASILPLGARAHMEGVRRHKLPAVRAEGLCVSPVDGRFWFGDRKEGTVFWLDAGSGKASEAFVVGKVPFRLAATAQGAIYVSDPPAESLLELDPAATSSETIVRRRIKVPGGPSGFVLHPDAGFAACSVGSRDEVAIVDLVRGAVHMSLPAGRHPDGVAWAPPPAAVDMDLRPAGSK